MILSKTVVATRRNLNLAMGKNLKQISDTLIVAGSLVRYIQSSLASYFMLQSL